MEDDSSLKHWLMKIDAGDLTNWQGWRAEWGLEDIQKVLQSEGEPQPAVLGDRPLRVYAFSLTQQTQPLQVFADSLGQVALLRLEDASLTKTAQELEELWGTPALQRELPSDHRFAPAQLRVFPKFGVALYVLDPNKRGKLSLSAIAFFPGGMRAEAFLHDLEGDERMRMSED